MSRDNISYKEATIDDLPLILKWTELLMAYERLDTNVELHLKKNISPLLEDWLRNLISDNNSLIIIANSGKLFNSSQIYYDQQDLLLVTYNYSQIILLNMNYME